MASKKVAPKYKPLSELYNSFTLDLDCTVISYWLQENHCPVDLTRTLGTSEYIEIKHTPRDCKQYLANKVVLKDEVILGEKSLSSELISDFSVYYSNDDAKLENPLLLVFTKVVGGLDLLLFKRKDIVRIYYFRNKQGKWYGYTLSETYPIYYVLGLELDKKEAKLNDFTLEIIRTLKQCNGKLFTLFYVKKDGFDVMDFCPPSELPYPPYHRQFKQHNANENPPINYYPGTTHTTPRVEHVTLHAETARSHTSINAHPSVHPERNPHTGNNGYAGGNVHNAHVENHVHYVHPEKHAYTERNGHPLEAPIKPHLEQTGRYPSFQMVKTYEESLLAQRIRTAQRAIEILEGLLAGLLFTVLFIFSMHQMGRVLRKKV